MLNSLTEMTIKEYIGWKLLQMFIERDFYKLKGFPGSSDSKESTCNTRDPFSIPGSGRSAGEGIGYPLWYSWAFLVAQLVKNPPAMLETGDFKVQLRLKIKN